MTKETFTYLLCGGLQYLIKFLGNVHDPHQISSPEKDRNHKLQRPTWKVERNLSKREGEINTYR